MRSIITDVPRSVLCVRVSVYLSVCWAHGWAVQKRMRGLRKHVLDEGLYPPREGAAETERDDKTAMRLITKLR